MIVNLSTFSDADFVQNFVYQTNDGLPINLENDSLRLMVRLKADDPAAFMECSTFNRRILVSNPYIGAFSLIIPVKMLVNLPPGVYVHSLIKTSSHDLSRKEIWRGTLTHSAGPTRWTLGTT